LPFVEDQAHGAGFELIGELAARGRRFGVSAIGLDIVFPSGKMSTESDHTTVRLLCRSGERCKVKVHAFLRLRPHRWAFSSPGPALIKARFLRNQAP
jgi:hypothetical protein